MRLSKWQLVVWISAAAVSSASADPFALIGGFSGSTPDPYAAFVNSTGVQTIPLGVTDGQINSVALNTSGLGLIGGETILSSRSYLYAAFVAPGSPANVTPLFPLNSIYGTIESVALNNSSQGLMGGEDTVTGFLYAAYANLPSTVTTISAPVGIGVINSVGLAPSINLGIIGGQSFAAPYAAFVTPTNTTPTAVTSLPVDGTINSVSVSDSGLALIGGQSSPGPLLYAAFVNVVDPSVAASSVIFPGAPSGFIQSVAINNSDLGLIGGQDFTNSVAYASFVRPLEPASNLLTFSGRIDSVALNGSGQGLIGGRASGSPYAAFVNQTGGSVLPVFLGLNNGTIDTVAINQFGQGLIGGRANSVPYLALVDSNYPSHPPIVIGSLPSSGSILSLSYVTSPIPTTGLHGNNLAFAEYINENVPRDLFYLYPSTLAGEFADALESAIPTRNAISLFTAENNTFILTHGLSTHLRNHRHFRNRLGFAPLSKETVSFSLEDSEAESEELVALGGLGQTRLGFGKRKDSATESAEEKKCAKEAPGSLWFEAIGALGYQKAQNQTPGFDPKIAGGILAFDGQVADASQVGFGLAYTYTHIHDHRDAGWSKINQEYAFVYMTTSDEKWYFDFAFWGSLFQTSQTRKIHMTEWEFTSRSSPHGWQICPHIEMGYDYIGKNSCTEEAELVVNLFIMADWANAWQNSYKEKGNSPFNASQDSHYSSLIRSEGGIRFYEPIAFDSWSLTFEEKFSYVNKSPQKIGSMRAFIVGSPGSFAVETLNNIQNLGGIELSAIFASKDPSGSYASLTYMGELSGSYQLHQLILEFSCNF